MQVEQGVVPPAEKNGQHCSVRVVTVDSKKLNSAIVYYVDGIKLAVFKDQRRVSGKSTWVVSCLNEMRSIVVSEG